MPDLARLFHWPRRRVSAPTRAWPHGGRPRDSGVGWDHAIAKRPKPLEEAGHVAAEEALAMP